MTQDSVLRSIRSQATEIARGWSAPGSPPSWALTAEIFTVLAHDEGLLAVAAEIPPERMPALLFCAAACYLIGEEEPPGLVDYFPVVGGGRHLPDSAFEPAFRAFCLARRAELTAVCDRRRYQMNEVARSTQVALALGVVGGRAPSQGIALIDLGTGAGLGLHLDRYRHQLDVGRELGDLTSPLVLHCETKGPFLPPVPRNLPPIEWRVGIDLDPLDLADPDDHRWARSCLPPERDSLDRFDQATRLALSHPCSILRGDALETLASVFDDVPDSLLPVVVDTYTAVFFSDQERSRFHDLVDQCGAVRDLIWISLDPLVPLGTAGRYSVQDLDVPDDLVVRYQQSGVFALLGLVSFEQGRRSGGLLASAHPSGTSMTWLEGSGG
jgi:hypothetical protein